MKQKLPALLTFLMLSLRVLAADGDTFTASTTEGVTVTYTVISESAKTCEVGRGYVKNQGTIYAVDQTVSGSVTIPSQVNGYTVVAVADYAFFECSNIQSISLPLGVTVIGNRAFTNCSSLTSVNIPEGVSRLEDFILKGCSSLENVVLPSSISYIGKNVFESCSGLTFISIPANAVIGVSGEINATFSGCTGLRNIVLGDGVTIYNKVFKKLSSLESVTLGNSVGASYEAFFNDVYPNAMLYVPVGKIDYYSTRTPWNTVFSASNIKENTERTINVATAGTLSTLISESDKNVITSLTLTGSLNGEDLRFIREMAGSDYNGVPTDGNLSTLDLSGAIIVAGGSYVKIQDKKVYWNKEKTSYTSSFSVVDGEKVSEDNVIGDCLFAGCQKLQTIILPENITAIREFSFWATGLTAIIIPNTVTSIGLEAFFSCWHLTSVAISSSVTSIGNSAFLGCSNLESITVDSNNSVYDSRNNCNAIIEKTSNTLIVGSKNTTIPNGVIIIGGRAFADLSLTCITIPGSVTSIGDSAFRDCGLTSITIPSSVTNIVHDAFRGNNLTSITIPSSVTFIGGSAFADNELQTVIVENPTPVAIYDNTFTNRANADLIVPVGSISAYKAADYWKEFKTIKDTEGRTEDASGSPVATERTIDVATAGTLSTLISEAEKNVITSLTLTGSLNGEDLRFLREMAGNSYNGNPTEGNLSYLDMSGAAIVAGGNYLQLADDYIHLSNSGRIGVYNNNPFVSVANTLGDYVFAGCSKLETIKMPTGVVTVGRFTFSSCKLTTIVWPTALTSIGMNAFSSNNITSFTLPASVTNIDSNILAACRFLTELSVESGNAIYDSRDNCNAIIKTNTNELLSAISATTIPSTVTSIGNEAFASLGLTSINIPNSVTSIGNDAFNNNQFTSVTIPANVTSIGNGAFRFCNELTSITVAASSPIAISEYTFTETNHAATLIVPVGSISAYRNASYWSQFGTIQDTNGNTADAVATERTIDVATAGTLSTLITAEEKNVLTKLTLTGSLNGVDFRFIREMAGSDYNGVPTDGNLTTLDLSGATIVAGGVYVEIQDKKVYYNKEKTSYSSSYSVVDGEKVSEANKIGAYLFAGCQKLQTITLPNNITAIDDFGFWATGLTAITMPNTVTSIGYDAFFCCSNLASVAIPSSVTSIRYSFLGCTNLVSITVDSNNSKYDSRDDCNAIIEKSSNTLIVGCKNTTIPDGVTTIGGGALSNLNLTSITIPGSVTTIDNNAFGGNNLTSITIPSSVTSIGNYAFANNNELQTVTVQNPTPVAIYDETFTNRSNIDLIVPVGSISAYKAANYWKEFKTIKDTEGNTVDASNPNVIHVETAGTLSTLLTNPMTITELTITGNLNGTDFRLLREMAGSDYQGNPTEGKLRYLNLSGATIVDGGEKYLDADDVTINKSNPNYSPSIIHVGTIAQNYGEDIDFLTHNNDLSHFLFIGCVKLEELVLPQNITSIGSYVFYYCWNLNTMQIPASVTSVKKYALWFCTGLTSLTIPKTLTSIGDGAFCGLTNATSITVEGDNPNYDSRENCNAIIETSANKLLAGCKNTLIPNGITRIENNALRNLDITSITIPSSVTSIGSQAFANIELQTVTVQNSTPITIQESTFSNRSNIDLVVPVGSISAYKAADYWKEFKTIKDTAGNSEDASDPSGIDVTDISQLDNAIYIEPTEGRVSEVVDLPVKLKNTMSAVGCSFKLTLPEDFTLQKDGDGDIIYDLGTRAKKMSLTFHGDNNTYDFAMTPSSGTATISGNDGVVVTFKVVIPENATEGAHALRLTNNLIQRMVDETIKDFAQPDITTVINVSNYVTGDANGDGVVTPSDAIMILYYYFNVSLNGFNVKAADLNGDGNITPADAIAALYLYFNAGSANTRSMHVDDELDPE